ncbi:hypothetical protein [Limnobacter sp.]|uniref:hypothetical protein n=1 Tax=Limnobacter sp. TaxID=2003368 RepID=UPI0035114A0B
MTGLSEQDIIKALASWVHQQKCPYTSRSKQGMVVATNLPNAWIEFKSIGQSAFQVSSIHTVLAAVGLDDLANVRHEVMQFNKLMERVKLPVFVWEDKKLGQFQLHWQETVYSPLETRLIQSLFEQSLYLANALKGRLTWALKSLPTQLMH